MKRLSSYAVILWSVIAITFTIDCALADRRVALVIGNSKYEKIPKLGNPANDAPDVAEALTKLGFDVIMRTDIDKRGFDGAFKEFARKSVDSDVSLFYYAGHGMQYQKQNFLLPIDIGVEDDFDVKYDAISIDTVMNAVNVSKGVKIVILDACRDNPLEKSQKTASRGVEPNSRGLARLDRTEGMVVAYATAADKTADDGVGRNSPFTEALVRRLAEPGLEVGLLFRRVAQDVYERTNKRQFPELSISLLNEYYLNLTDTDSLVWGRIRDSQNPADLQDFIQKYPNSPYTRDAQFRLESFQMIGRLNDERARREQDRLEREQSQQLLDALKKERAELLAERQAIERREAERREAEKQAADKREADRKIFERQDVARQESERLANEKREADRREIERVAQEKREAEKAAVAQREAARKEAERVAMEKKAETERLARVAQENARLETARKAEEKREAARVATEAARIAAMQAGQAREEAEHIAAEKKQAEKLAAEQREAARKEAQQRLAAEKQAEQERIRVASLEAADLKKQQVEAEKSKMAATCARESDDVRRLTNEKGKPALELLRKEAACPTTPVAVNKAIKDLATAEARACESDNKALAKVGAKDLNAMRAAVVDMTCDKVRGDATSRIAKLEAEEHRMEVACASESEKVTEAKSDGVDGGLAKLGALQKALVCVRLQPVIADAIKELAPLAPKAAQIDSRRQILEAQTELKRMRCYAGNLNGNLNNGTKSAISKYFAKVNASDREAHFNDELIEELKHQDADLCPPPPVSAPVASRPSRDEDEDEPIVRRRPQRAEPEGPAARHRPQREQPVAARPKPVRAVAQAREARPVAAARAPASRPAPVASAPRVNIIGVGF